MWKKPKESTKKEIKAIINEVLNRKTLVLFNISWSRYHKYPKSKIIREWNTNESEEMKKSWHYRHLYKEMWKAISRGSFPKLITLETESLKRKIPIGEIKLSRSTPQKDPCPDGFPAKAYQSCKNQYPLCCKNCSEA